MIVGLYFGALIRFVVFVRFCVLLFGYLVLILFCWPGAFCEVILVAIYISCNIVPLLII